MANSPANRNFVEESQGQEPDGDTTVVDNETYLGPTETYQSPPHILMNQPRAPITPERKPPMTRDGSPRDHSHSPVNGHVLTDVTNDCDYDKEEFERERLMWEAWRDDQMLQIRWAMRRLQDSQKKLGLKKFPCFEDWHRNCQLAKAAEGGLKYYTNDEDFDVGSLGGVRQQMLGREMKRTLEQVAGIADQHPANRAFKRLVPAGERASKTS